jgi:hypothetical protein
MSDEKGQQPEKKIIIDEDWKAQVRAEKERTESGDRADERSHEAGEPKQRATLPSANIGFLFSTLATQALLSLGLAPNPLSGKTDVDVEQAKHFIDMLAVLEEKTKGNLTDEEKRTLDSLLFDLRMAFVEVSGRQQK